MKTTLSLIVSTLAAASLAAPTASPMEQVEEEGSEPINQYMDESSVKKAARVAKTLVMREAICNVVGVDPDSGAAMSFPEYYIAKDGTGEPILSLLGLNLTKGIVEHAQFLGVGTSITVRSFSTDHTKSVIYPGIFDNSVLGAPRVSIRGKINKLDVDAEEDSALTLQLLSKNGNDRNATKLVPKEGLGGSWAMMDIEEVYLLGGFRGLAYVGDIPVNFYLEAEPFSDEELSHWSPGY